MNDIVLATKEELADTSFVATPTGLEIIGEPTYEDWEEFGRRLDTVETAYQWVRGDWLNQGEWRYGEMYSQALDESQARTWKQWKWVADRFEMYWRQYLKFDTYQSLAGVSDDKDIRYKFVRAATQRKWTVAKARNQVRMYKQWLARNSAHQPQLQPTIKLYEGDMLEVVPTLGKFDLVCTDPPYGVTDYEWDDLQTADWLATLIPHLADEYNLFWFCSPKYAADIEMIFRELDLPIKSRIVWHRRNMSMGSAARDKFIDTWEMILHAGNRALNFPDEWSDAWFDVQTHAAPQSNFKDTKLHETQKPKELIRRLVEFGSRTGDSILDPFAGSGTTGVVCPNDRECILIERNPKYVGIIEARLGVRCE